MPMQTGRDPLADKLNKRGLGSATKKHAADETNYGTGGQLPAGVRGVAELVECRFGEFKPGTQSAGEAFVYMAGVVKTPTEFEGMRTSRMISLTDDPKDWNNPRSFEEKVEEALNEFRKIGADTKSLENGGDHKDWVAFMSALQEAGPHFNFHTYESKPPKNATAKQVAEFKPRVYEIWDRPAVGFVEGTDTGVVDNTATSNGSPHEEPATSGDDWLELARLAEDNDVEAQRKLSAACKEHGIDSDNAASWEAAATELIAVSEGGGSAAPTDGGDAAEGAWKPAKGDIYKYKKKGARDAEDYEVTAVFSETVNLKRAKDGLVLRGIRFTNDPDAIDGQPV